MTAAGTISRRGAMARLMGSGAVLLGAATIPSRLIAATASTQRIGDAVLAIDVDPAMRTQLSFHGRPVTAMEASDALRLADNTILDSFLLLDAHDEPVAGINGAGRRHVLRGTASGAVERQMSVTLLDAFPGLALIETCYRNTAKQPIAVAGWRGATHDLLAHPEGAWSFAGASYPDRRDWVQKVAPGFEQRNFLGMNGSDYGGGTPMAVAWRRDVGLAVGHVETTPKLVSLPVSAQPSGTRIGIAGDQAVLLKPGETLTLPTTLLMVHTGDHFAALDAYRRIMAERGLKAPAIPPASYAPIWCAWGYERDFTVDQVVATLPKAKAVGCEWAVLDDGWQTSEGDWKVDRTKFPNGDSDIKAFADRIKAAGMRPRLWYSPLAIDPGTDLLRDHPDMLILDENGAAQNVSWWNSFTACPAYQPTIEYYRGQVRRMLADWGWQGLKLDGQHLNGVAPCYNPAHKHARPEESYEKLQDFWKALYDEAMAVSPDTVVEICPCGDSFAFHNIPGMNNTPASDPESSWQVRLKGKTFKAMMGPSAPYSGDHVELSDGGDDWASTYGIGAIPSTKFTWPHDTTKPTDKLPPGGFVLTAAREATWRKWIGLYQANRLAEGTYLGGLYDIGFDKPEGHVVSKDERLHYAFYAKRWSGPIELRGLGGGAYRLKDSFTGRPLGTIRGEKATIPATFERFLVIEATPLATQVAA